MKVLVTGATGFIGTALLEQLKKSSNDIICQSRNAHFDDVGVKWIKHDLVEDSWDFLPTNSIDVVYHLAGQTSVYNALEDPVSDLKSNVFGLLKLLEHFRKWDRPPFVVYAGTVTEVGLVDSLPVNESVPDHPITFYDLSKLTAERYLKQYIRDGLAKGCVLRLANIFGRRKYSQKEDRGILDKIYELAISGQSIIIFGDGNYLRDYVFIDDVISAILLAPAHQERTNGQHFNIGTGQGITLKEAFLKVTLIAEDLTGSKTTIEHVPPPEHFSSIEFRNATYDPTAFSQATGWVPMYDFDSALKKAYCDS